MASKKSLIPRACYNGDLTDAKLKAPRPPLIAPSNSQSNRPAPNDGLLTEDDDAVRRNLLELQADHVRMKKTLEDTVKDAEESLAAMKLLMEEREKRFGESLGVAEDRSEELQQQVEGYEKALIENNIDPVTGEVQEPTGEQSAKVEAVKKVTKETTVLRIHYSEHKTNKYIRQRIDTLAGKQEPLLSIMKRRKLAWFGHVNRHDSLAKTILQGMVEEGAEEVDNARHGLIMSKSALKDITKLREKLQTMNEESDKYLTSVQDIMRDIEEVEATSLRAGGGSMAQTLSKEEMQALVKEVEDALKKEELEKKKKKKEKGDNTDEEDEAEESSEEGEESGAEEHEENSEGKDESERPPTQEKEENSKSKVFITTKEG